MTLSSEINEVWVHIFVLNEDPVKVRDRILRLSDKGTLWHLLVNLGYKDLQIFTSRHSEIDNRNLRFLKLFDFNFFLRLVINYSLILIRRDYNFFVAYLNRLKRVWLRQLKFSTCRLSHPLLFKFEYLGGLGTLSRIDKIDRRF